MKRNGTRNKSEFVKCVLCTNNTQIDFTKCFLNWFWNQSPINNVLIVIC